jgi:hypothetical protein
MHKIDNRGSATIELSLIAPVILLIIVLIIKLYIGLIDEGNVCGSSYSSLYLYDVSEDGTIDDSLEEIAGYTLTGKVDSGSVSISAVSDMGSVTYKTEYDKSSSRLRRWQLYGDVIH